MYHEGRTVDRLYMWVVVMHTELSLHFLVCLFIFIAPCIHTHTHTYMRKHTHPSMHTLPHTLTSCTCRLERILQLMVELTQAPLDRSPHPLLIKCLASLVWHFPDKHIVSIQEADHTR